MAIVNFGLQDVDRIDQARDRQIGAHPKLGLVSEYDPRVATTIEWLQAASVDLEYIMTDPRSHRPPQYTDAAIAHLGRTVWECIIAIQHLTHDSVKVGNALVDAKIAIAREALSQGKSVNGAWMCPMCGSQFINGQTDHSPCTGPAY